MTDQITNQMPQMLNVFANYISNKNLVDDFIRNAPKSKRKALKEFLEEKD